MRKPMSVSELLAKGKTQLQRLQAGAETANRTLVATQQALPPELAGHVFGATLDAEGVLTLLVDSGAWATRLRYVLADLTPRLTAALDGAVIARTVIRVRPR